MTRIALVRHPDTPSVFVSSIDAEIARVEEGMIVIRYSAMGDVAKLSVPEPVQYSTRQPDLWRTTCFEAFAASRDEGAYLEFNFAPSTGWAAFRFSGRREGRTDLALQAPHFDVDRLPDRLDVTVAVGVADLVDLPADRSWKMNLSAVIEETDGTISYWALAHPSGAPDFHHPGCFVLELPPPERL
jgi:hypothetical protein